MAWLIPLLQYGSGPVVAAGAVVFTNWRTSKREDQRRAEDRDERAKDRSHERTMAQMDREAALGERWRDERRAAHAELIEHLDHSVEHLRAYAVDGDNEEREQEAQEALQRLIWAYQRARKGLSVVDLVASQESLAAARAAVDHLGKCHLLAVAAFARAKNGGSRDDAMGYALTSAEELSALAAAYLDAARVDLGTG